MNENKRIYFICQTLLILSYTASLIVGILSILISIITFFAVDKWFSLLTLLGGLILLPQIKRILKFKLGFGNLYLNIFAILLIFIGFENLTERNLDKRAKELGRLTIESSK